MTQMRKYWLDKMLEIASPVLENLAEGTLYGAIPKEFHKERKDFILLEAFGRTACGIAPWLEGELDEGEEKSLQKKYRELMHRCIRNAVNPENPDYMNWSEKGGQPLVDAAFLAHALVRAPKSMYFSLDKDVQRALGECLKKSRKITPANCNWLFFSAMVEAALFVMGEDYDITAVEKALDSFENWYVGDGTYSDGEFFHWDYYNSFVIHPMQIDILKAFGEIIPEYKSRYSVALSRASRFAAVLERLISHDGTYAVFGRSCVYRFGAFHLLSQGALQGFLPPDLSEAQVRCALDSVIHKVCENGDMLDEKGFLTPGVYGFQPDMAEEYINVGSLYLCLSVFLPLGLPGGHSFWASEDEMWTSKKIWTGENTRRDCAVD